MYSCVIIFVIPLVQFFYRLFHCFCYYTISFVMECYKFKVSAPPLNDMPFTKSQQDSIVQAPLASHVVKLSCLLMLPLFHFTSA